MTRYKEELRKRGFELECDYECLPCDGVETVESRVLDDGARYYGIEIAVYHISAGWCRVAIDNRGDMHSVSEYGEIESTPCGNWND